MLELGVNAEARSFSEPGAGIPHAGIFGGAGGQLPVLRYLCNFTSKCCLPSLSARPAIFERIISWGAYIQ